MNPDELFDQFPELLLRSFRKQLLLGIIPAEVVGKVLEPLLANFWDVMLRLSPDLQADFENILRIYPDVAAQFGLRMKPPIEKTISKLAEYFLKRERQLPIEDGTAAVLDLAAEEQKEFDVGKKSVVIEGQGFFETDRGNSVFLEFSFKEGGDSILFSRKPVEMAVDIHIRGLCALSLRQGEPDKRIGIEEFLEVCKEGTFPARSVKIVERLET